MKILILDESIPYPLNSGKKIRTYNLIKRLARDNEIYYLTFFNGGGDQKKVINHFQEIGIRVEELRIKLQKKSGALFYFKLLANLFSKYPYIVTSHYNKAYQNRVNELVESFKPDFIMAEWTPYARYLFKIENVTAAVTSHNIESRIWDRYYINESNIFKKAYIKIQAQKVREFEKKVFESIDHVFSVSPIEKDVIEEMAPGASVAVIDNGVDTDYFSNDNLSDGQPILTFTGSMDWRPNQDAVHYYVNDILPLIKSEVDDVKTFIVGRTPPSNIKAFDQTNGISITGEVPDVRPYTLKSSVFLVPLRIGGGTRLKILEAMSMKRPVVSTKVGAEGLEVTDGLNIELAETAEEFASKCIMLLNDKEHADRIASNGYDLVCQKYRWEILAKKMGEAINDWSGK